jgi:hypothetical protein
MTDLSPAAQAVLGAFLSEWDVYAVNEARWATAAALRAAALYCKRDTLIILALADELEGTK